MGSYIQSHLPDPSFSFDNNNTGSDVLRMIDRFLDNTVVPVCGSKMIIYVKRYPNETEYSQVIEKMRQHHSYLTIFASNEPSGGYHPETLYDIASKTNGLCAFDDDENFKEAAGYVETVANPYLVYAANPQTSGKGCIQLSPFLVESDCLYSATMMMQDNDSMTVVQQVLLSWVSHLYEDHLGMNGTKLYGAISGNYAGGRRFLNNDTYNVQLDYVYTDRHVRRVQVRMNQRDPPINYWVPYDN